MRYLIMLFFCVSLIFTSCQGPSVVTKSTCQPWLGGAAGSGTGKNYTVLIQKPLKTEIKIESVWLGSRTRGKQFTEFSVLPAEVQTPFPGFVVPADVVGFRVCFSEYLVSNTPRQGDGDRPALADVPAEMEMPADFNSGALIRYTEGKKKGFFIVTSFENLRPIAYP